MPVHKPDLYLAIPAYNDFKSNHLLSPLPSPSKFFRNTPVMSLKSRFRTTLMIFFTFLGCVWTVWYMNSISEDSRLHHNWQDSQYTHSDIGSDSSYDSWNVRVDTRWRGNSRRPLKDLLKDSLTSPEFNKDFIYLAKTDPTKFVSTLISSHKYLLVGISTCPFTSAAKDLLLNPTNDGVPSISPYIIDLDLIPNSMVIRKEMKKQAGHATFPIIFVQGQVMGGYDDIHSIISSSSTDNVLLKKLHSVGLLNDPSSKSTLVPTNQDEDEYLNKLEHSENIQSQKKLEDLQSQKKLEDLQEYDDNYNPDEDDNLNSEGNENINSEDDSDSNSNSNIHQPMNDNNHSENDIPDILDNDPNHHDDEHNSYQVDTSPGAHMPLLDDDLQNHNKIDILKDNKVLPQDEQSETLINDGQDEDEFEYDSFDNEPVINDSNDLRNKLLFEDETPEQENQRLIQIVDNGEVDA